MHSCLLQLSHVAGMAIYNGRIFWSDTKTSAVYSANKYNATDEKKLMDFVQVPGDVVVRKAK